MKFRAQTRDLELWPCPGVPMAALCVLHIVPQVNIWPKFRENPPRGKGETEQTQMEGSNTWPWTVTLTLSLHGWIIDSAHRLTKVNIWPKFKENPSTGIGDTERTRNSRLKPVTLNFDLNLESAWLSYVIVSLRQTYDQSLKKILPGV